ncbi:MAG: histidine kinase [Saprospiraceae bacterium]
MKSNIESIFYKVVAYRLVLVASFALTSIISFAQSPYSKTYSTHEGLIHPQITTLFKDTRNYLWIGTKGGVSRFNGKSFENFDVAQLGIYGDIHQFYEDSSHCIWVVAKDGLSIFNGSEWKPYKFEHPLHDASGSAFYKDSFFYIDNYSELNIFSHGQFFSRKLINQCGKALRNILFDPLSQKFYTVLANSFSIGIYENDTVRIYKNFQPEELGAYPVLKTYVYRVFKNNIAWIFDLKDSLIAQIPVLHGFGEYSYTPNDSGESLYWSALYGLNNKNSNLHSFFKSTRGKPDIICVLIDTYNYWLGTERGLVKIPKAGFQFYNKDSIPFPWAISEDNHQNMIVGDFLNGLYMIKPDGCIQKISSKDRWYFHPALDPTGRTFLYRENEIYILYQNELQYVPKLSKENPEFTASLFLTWSTQLHKLLGAQRGGLFIYDPNTQELEFVKWDHKDFLSFHTLCLYEDPDGMIWAGSRKGLIKYDIQKRNFQYFPNEACLAKGILSICKASDTSFYIGTYNGVWEFGLRSNTYSLSLEILHTNIISSLTNYKDSLLLISHNKGITVWNLKDKTQYREFNYNNGFPGMMPDQNAAYVDSRSNYYVGAFDRLCVIPVHDLWHDEEAMRLQYTKLNGQYISYQPNILTCKNGKGISIEFDLIGTNRPVDCKFRYRIQNKTGWSDWFGYQYFILPELASGTYNLELETNWDELQNNPLGKAALLKFKVEQQIWKEPYFPILVSCILVLFILGLIYAFYHYKMSQKKVHLLKQESKYHQARMLTAQINPHFMSNFLTSIQNSVSYQDTERANEKLLQVADFLRKFLGSINSNEQGGLIRINEELEIIRIFLEMQNVLHNGNLDWKIQLPPTFDATEWCVPPLILQPYVENAVVWGIDGRESRKGMIRILLTEHQHSLEVTIEDDGIGIAQAKKSRLYRERKQEESGAEIVRQRLALLKTMGIEISLSISSNENGTVVQISYPKIKS